MSNTTKRKKAHQKFCRDQVKKGLINQPNGSWAEASATKAMDQMMIAGYNFDKRKRKPSKRNQEIE